jgi:serine/threonine-protein kinase PknK
MTAVLQVISRNRRRDNAPICAGVFHPVQSAVTSTAREAGLVPGARIGSRYRVERPLGSGGEASTYEVVDEPTGARLALKLLADATHAETLRAEFALLARLRHPALTRVRDFGWLGARAASRPYYTADRIDGTTLELFCGGRRWAEIRRPLGDALAALAELHRFALVHGDVTPRNVMVDTRGHGVLIDLGCARRAGASSERVSGTRGYLAPEWARGAPSTPREDVFAIGRVLEWIAERARGGVPARVSALAERCLRADPDARPADVGEVLEALGLPPPSAASDSGEHATLLGREEVLRALAESAAACARRSRAAPRVIALVGHAGSGRTAALREAAMHAALELEVIELVPTETDALTSAISRAAERPVRTQEDVIRWASERAMHGPPVVIAIDDIERLPEPEQAAIGALIRVVPGDGAIALWATARDGAASSVAGQMHPLTLPALDAATLAPWALRYGVERGAPAIAEATLGLPGRIVEVMRRLARRETLAVALRDLRAGADGAGRSGGGAPIEAALARCTDEERDALIAVSLLERLTPALGERIGVADHALVELERIGLVRRERDGDRLASPEDARAYVAGLAPLVRQSAVAHVAGALTASGAAREIADAVALLARHGLRDSAHALHEEHRAALSVEPTSAAHATRALLEADAPRIDLGIALAHVEACLAAGDTVRAIRTLARALRAVGRRPLEPALAFELPNACATTYVRAARFARARRWAERARAAASTADDRARADDVLARAAIGLGQFAVALERAESALEAGAQSTIAGALAESAGIAATYLGQGERARAHLERAVEGARGAPRSELRAVSCLAILELREGHLGRAEIGFRHALAIAEREGMTDQAVSAALNLGTALHARGALGDALVAYERALPLAIALARTSSIATLRYDLAVLFLDAGAIERAASAHALAEEAAETERAAHVRVGARILAGEIARARGRRAEAATLFERALESAREEGLVREQAEVWLHLAEVELDADGDGDGGENGGERREIDRARGAERGPAPGGADRASELLGRAEALIRAHRIVDLGAKLAGVEARIAARQGELERAFSTIDAALGDASVASALPRAAELATIGCEIATAAGATAIAAGHRARARALYERMGAGLPAALRAELFRDPRRAVLRDPETAAPVSEHRARGLPARLSRLLEINRQLTASLDLGEVLRATMDAAIELTGAERGFLLLESSPGALSIAIARNLDRAEPESRELSRGIAEHVWQRGTPVLTVDALVDQRFEDHVSVQAMRLRSIVCVPVRGPEGVLGVLYLDNRHRRARFDDDDVEVVLAFADQAGIAVRNARLHGALEARARELEDERARLARKTVEQGTEIGRLTDAAAAQRALLDARLEDAGMVGRSDAIRRVVASVDRVASSELPVLIRGESGTGKELVARAIHRGSRRSSGPFLAINCSAVAESLLEAELFGSKRGAFTGADRDRDGYFVLARGGTLFFDELGEMPLAMQPKLLRVLETREVRPLGAIAAEAIDVRIVAATHRDLRAEVAAGRFREDLFYRLAVVDVWLPPLRERRDDIVALAQHFVSEINARDARSCVLRPSAIRKLLAYPYPGNVRELRNLVERAALLTDGDAIEAGAIDLQDARPSKPARAVSRAERDRQERDELVAALERHRWNVSEVSRSLDIPRTTLYRKLGKHQLHEPR